LESRLASIHRRRLADPNDLRVECGSASEPEVPFCEVANFRDAGDRTDSGRVAREAIHIPEVSRYARMVQTESRMAPQPESFSLPFRISWRRVIPEKPEVQNERKVRGAGSRPRLSFTDQLLFAAGTRSTAVVRSATTCLCSRRRSCQTECDYRHQQHYLELLHDFSPLHIERVVVQRMEHPHKEAA
jgi:hypothetical protein